MELEEAITTYLMAQTGLTALIDRRLFYDERPIDSQMPSVVVLNISDVKDHTHEGLLPLESPVFQFTVYAADKLAAKAVSKQIKAALSDHTGDMGGITVHWVRLMNELCTLAQIDESNRADTVMLEFEINFERVS